MHLKASYKAILILTLFCLSSFHHPAIAQQSRFGAAVYPRVSSVLSDSSGNFLLLNLLSRKALSPPSLHYLSDGSGLTVLLADFSGLVFSDEPRSIKPANESIERVRIGQIQSSPPLVRISVSARDPAALKQIEFRCQPKSLVIKFPEKLQLTESSRGTSRASAVASQPKSEQKKPSLPVSAPGKLSLTNPPFSRGGLFLDLGPEPITQFPISSAPEPADSSLPRLVATEARKARGNASPVDLSDARSDSNSSLSGIKSPSASQIAASKDTAALNQASSSDMMLAAAASAGACRIEYLSFEPLKVRLCFDSLADFKSFQLDDPPRFVLDLCNASYSVDPPPAPDPNPYLKSLRVGKPDGKSTRLVFDLGQSNLRVLETLDESKKNLLLSFSAAASPGLPREVFIDAGHGGSDPGAQRGDVQEKELTLAIAQKTKAFLEAKGIRVSMTREDDSFVSLEDRVRLCNERRPDAFVSIHINSLVTDRDISGIETYYQSEQSRALADRIHEQLLSGLKVADRNVRKARFYVVNHNERPAVLAEVGFISNKDERDKLISSDYQAKIAESLGRGVMLFLSEASGSAEAKAAEGSTTGLTTVGRSANSLASRLPNAVKQISSETENGSREFQGTGFRQQARTGFREK